MPSLSETINAHIRAAAADQHTSIPARVLSYDPSKQTVDVTPAINTQYSGGEVQERGAIRAVPVQFGGTTRTLMSFPIKAGDYGVLVFQERSIDEWSGQSEKIAALPSNVIAKDRRMHDYNDCIFVPGIHPFAQSPVGGKGHIYQHDPQQDTVIKHNIGTPAECYMFMKPDGSIIFQNKEVHMQLLVDGTVKLDCKKVVVNATTSMEMTTPDMTITADTLTMDVGDTSWSGSTVDMTVGAITTTGSTVDMTAAVSTTGTLTNNSVNVGSTHVHTSAAPGSPTSVPY